MPEPVIKRVNFFDGQFLKQGEFLDLDLYQRHMRRRMLYMFFDKSGVIQRGAELTIEVESASLKQIRVRAGTALGMRDDLAEAREIVLREDEVLDLNLLNPPLLPGDTAMLTIHYGEEATEPSSEGGVTGNTRILEQAIVTAHRNALPGPAAANGEPFVRLGSVAFDSLAISPPRDTSFLRSALLAELPTITVSPNQVTAGTSASLAVTSSGLDLSTLAVGHITPMAGITNLVVGATTATTATITFDVQPGATAGSRTLTITIGAATAEATLTVQPGLQVTGFAGVDEPGGDDLFKINGSGFVAPVTVHFSASGGGFTVLPDSVTVTGANVTPTQIRIPMAQIPVNAVAGPVRVDSGGQTAESAMPVVPPAVINTAPASVARNNPVVFGGLRLYAPILIRIEGTTSLLERATPTFPDAALGELLSDTSMTVFVPNSMDAGTYTVTVETEGGTVNAPDLNITLF